MISCVLFSENIILNLSSSSRMQQDHLVAAVSNILDRHHDMSSYLSTFSDPSLKEN